jgi:hypothetical protein
VSGPGDPAGLADEELEEIMSGFRRIPGGVSARFTPDQASVLRGLVSQVAELIGGPGSADPAADGSPGAGSPGLGGDVPGGDVPGFRESPPGGAGLILGDAPPDAGPVAGGGRAADPLAPAFPAGDPPVPGFPAAGEIDLAGFEADFGAGGPSAPPDDPVLARLFPDAYAGDEASSGEFRRFTEAGLRSGKVAGAQTVLATLPGTGGRVRLPAGDAEAWVRVLNDVRLALGVRLGITEDYEHELPGAGRGELHSAYLQVYDWLTFLQETLVRALW